MRLEVRPTMRHETRRIDRTPEEKARLKAIRERFQREKPSAKKLADSGEYGPPIPTAAYFAVAGLLKRLRAGRGHWIVAGRCGHPDRNGQSRTVPT